LKLAIIGLSNSGKTTVFNALTGQNLETTIYPTVSGEPNLGVVKVPDPRVEKLAEIYKPKKITHATVEYIDYIGLTKGDVAQNRKVFDLIKDSDAIVHVVRAFDDDAVTHPLNDVNPLRDIETLELELIFGDLEFVEKRLAKMDEGSRRGKKPDEREKKLLLKCKEALEKEVPLRNVAFDEEEERAMKPLQFVSTKPEVVVVNVGEHDLGADKAASIKNEVEGYFSRTKDTSHSAHHSSLSFCGKIEMEIAQLSPEEAKAFLDDLGIQEPALNKLIHVSYDLLGLISFLTVGEDEVRAWTITKGTSAHKAAGKIHSDIERGFIRAEVIHYGDFISSGNMHAARDKGLLRLEGKTYEVRDGDIINFRFNV
jgi:GTP-binding protein YchF